MVPAQPGIRSQQVCSTEKADVRSSVIVVTLLFGLSSNASLTSSVTQREKVLITVVALLIHIDCFTDACMP